MFERLEAIKEKYEELQHDLTNPEIMSDYNKVKSLSKEASDLESTVKKLEKQVIITDTGIEISIPMEEYKSKDNVVITKEPDGTATITIRNIEGVTVK